MSGISIIINWSGPYSFDEAIELENQGLYLCFGRNRFGPKPKESKPLYCGISKRDVGIRIKQHSDKNFNHPDNEWWIGRQAYPLKREGKYLELAEWVIVYFTEPEFNEKKTKNLPRQETYLINKWYFPDSSVRRKKGRKKNIGVMQWVWDVLCWSPESGMVRGGDLNVWKH